MKNQLKYWDNFYQNENPPSPPSSFSKYIIPYIKDTHKTLLDIGCGNGRDSLFFENNGFDVISIDSSKPPKFLGDSNNFFKVDINNINFKVDIYYARFFIHAIKEKTLDSFIENLYKLMSKKSKFIFETRSTKGITNLEKKETNFKSSIGEKHFRMLYSIDYLRNKFEKKFEIDHLMEINDVAKYKTDNPYVIRGIISKK
jgi:SAM-dependent methyltransferase